MNDSFTIKTHITKEYIEEVIFCIDKIIDQNPVIAGIEKGKIISKAKDLLNDAIKNGLTYQNMRPSGNAGFAALTLGYYALLLLGKKKHNNKKINARLILENSTLIRDKETGKYSIRLSPQKIVELNPRRTEPAFLYQFLSKQIQDQIPVGFITLSRKDVEKLLESYEPTLLKHLKTLSAKLTDSKSLDRISRDIWENSKSFPNPFDPKKLPKGTRNPRNLAASIIFLSLKHKYYQYPKYKRGYLLKNYLKDLFPNNSTMETMVHILVPFYYKFLSEEMKQKIHYSPIERGRIYTKAEYEKKLWQYFKKILLLLDISDSDNLTNRAKDLYRKAIHNGFNYDELSIPNPMHLSVTLIYILFQEIEELNKIGIRETTDFLRDRGISIDEKSLNSIIREFSPYITPYISLLPTKSMKSGIFLAELKKILKKHKYFHRVDNMILVKLIMALFYFYNSDPNEFVNKLGIERDAQALLRMLSYENILVKEPVFEEVVMRIKYFIENYIINLTNKEKLRSMLEDYIYEKQTQRSEAQRIRNLKAREKLGQYGEFYHSSKIRVKNFLLMLGFSPYDGYDLWGNKTQWRNRYRIWSNFHHIPYDPKDKKEEDLIHIPIVNPNDIGNDHIYLTHNYISNLESQLVKDNISDLNKIHIKQKLEDIKERLIYNISIIKKSVLNLNPTILNKLKGCNFLDIEKTKERLMDNDFSWSKGIERFIPISKKDKRLTSEQTNAIIKDIKRLQKINTSIN